MSVNNEKLIFKIKNFQALTREVERFKQQESLLQKMAWLYRKVFAYLYAFTIIGYLSSKNRAIELERKSETARKARLNLVQQVAFEEQYIKEIGNEIYSEFSRIEKSIYKRIEMIRENPGKYTELENKLLHFVDKFNFDHSTNAILPYDEVLFYKSALDLYGQIVNQNN